MPVPSSNDGLSRIVRLVALLNFGYFEKNTGCGSNDGTFQKTNRCHAVSITKQTRGLAYRLDGPSVGRPVLDILQAEARVVLGHQLRDRAADQPRGQRWNAETARNDPLGGHVLFRH